MRDVLRYRTAVRTVALIAIVTGCHQPSPAPPAAAPSPATSATTPPAHAACRICLDLGPWPFKPEAGDVLFTMARTETGMIIPPTRYVVTLFRDHRIVFRSDGARGNECRADQQLSPERASEIDAAVADLMQFADEYDGDDRTDSPMYVLTYWRAGGDTKTIHHYRGDRSKESVELEAVEDRIVTLLGVDGWTSNRYPSMEVMLECLVKQLAARAPH